MSTGPGPVGQVAILIFSLPGANRCATRRSLDHFHCSVSTLDVSGSKVMTKLFVRLLQGQKTSFKFQIDSTTLFSIEYL